MGATVIEDNQESDRGVGEVVTFHSTRSQNVENVNISQELSEVQRDDVRGVLNDFSDVLSDLPGRAGIIEHEIKLVHDKPINVKQYPLPFGAQEAIVKETKAMLEMDVIEPSSSSYCFPVVLVNKKDGTVRFCIDFRKLNAATVVDKEVIPNQEQLFTEISGAKFFTKIDLCKGYWQIPLADSSKQFTAFQTPLGLMQFKFMPFGLINAPATFARMMRLLLADINSLSYFDDILIQSRTWNEHMVNLKDVLRRLRECNVTAKPSKMYVGYSVVDFLGHVVGQGEQRPQEDKVSRILKLSVPQTKKQVQSLLGLLGYYRKFVDHFSEIVSPLNMLVRKNEPNKVKWTDNCQNALEKIQEIFSASPVLVLPDMSKTFVVRADASDTGIGAMLLQHHESMLRPCMYASRSLLEREKKYPIVERECLAIVFAVAKFSRYLLLNSFILETDHKPLLFLKERKTTNSRLMRWCLALQEYSFSVRAIHGSDNVHADVLSRL